MLPKISLESRGWLVIVNTSFSILNYIRNLLCLFFNYPSTPVSIIGVRTTKQLSSYVLHGNQSYYFIILY